MSVEVYEYDKREFPHCGVGPLDCDDEINPIIYNDQATALNMGRRMIPRRIISDTELNGFSGVFNTFGDAKIDFELSPNDPDFLIYIEFKMDKAETLTGEATGNLSLDFGIFSNANIRQPLGRYYVNIWDYQQATGTLIPFPNLSTQVGDEFKGIIISGQIDPALTQPNPGRLSHAYLKLSLSYPNINNTLYRFRVSRGDFNPAFDHPETGERFETSGIKGLFIYTGQL